MKAGNRFEYTINEVHRVKELIGQGLDRLEIEKSMNINDQKYWRLKRLIREENKPKGATVIDKDFEKPPCGLDMTKCFTPCYQGKRGNCPAYIPKVFNPEKMSCTLREDF